MIQPRSYQFKHIDEIIAKLAVDRATIGQLPTGGGKTVEFSMLINRYITKFPEKAVLVLVHRIELMGQTERMLQRMYGIKAELIKQGVSSVMRVPVYIGMVETVNNRSMAILEHLNIGLVIIDECHRGEFTKMFQIFQIEKIIGFTATPLSASKKTPLVDYYQSISVGPSIKQLITMGYLSQNITRTPQDVVDASMFAVDRMTGDFNLRQMAEEYRNPKFIVNTLHYYMKFCKRKKTLIFNVNVQHSMDVCETFNHAGFPCMHIDGETPPMEREKILRWFKETPDAILCNVGITDTGFDEPTVQSIILNFATLSMPKFIQTSGRGSRAVDEDFIKHFQKDYPYKLSIKTHFDIIDLGGNSLRHGDWCEERDWYSIFHYPQRPGRPGLAPTKVCPKCLSLVHAAIVQCKVPTGKMIIGDDGELVEELCGHIFDKKKYEEGVEFEKMITITKNIISEVQPVAEGKQPYFTFFEMGRMYVRKMIEVGMRLDKEKTDTIFQEYFASIKKWFAKQFPDKTFNESWHKTKARQHFDSTLKQKQDELQSKSRTTRRFNIWN